MQKFLRTLMLVALFAMPFASRAQVTTFPYSCDFEDATEAAAWTLENGSLTNQWVLGTAVNNTTSGSYGIYISNDAGATTAYTVSSAAAVYAYREFYFEPGEYTISFDWMCYGESNYDYLLAALVESSVTLTAGTSLPTGVSYTAITASGWTNLGPTSPNFKMNLSSTWNTQTATFTVTTAGTYRIVFVWRNDTSSGTAPGACVDNVSVTQNSCPMPSGLLANNITSSSMELTWTEIGSATSWLVYVNGEYAATANSTSYTLTGLDANTAYTIAVRSFCGTGDTSNAVADDFRTACPATTPLPYAEEFNGYTGFGSYPYYGPAVLPACWIYWGNGENTAETTGSSVYYGGVAQYNGTSYGSMESNNPYLYLPIQLTGANVTSSTYLGYATARGDVRYAVLPAFAESLSGLQMSFDYKMTSAYSATGAAAVLELGYVTNDDVATFVSMQSYNAVSSIQHVVDLNLSTLAAAAPAGARLAFKFSGVHNGTATSSYSNVGCGIDNITVEALPACSRALDVTVAAVTTNSVTLNWHHNVLNAAGTTYTVYNMADTTVVATGVNDTTYTVTGLTSNTDYTFGVEANCATSDAAITSVSGRTACAPEALPFTEDFSATLASDHCWRGANILYADGVTPTMGANSNWTYTSSVSNGIEAGHYRVNIYGTGCYKWLITPEIDLTTATNPMLTFDAAFTVYSSSSTGPATGFESNDSQKFMILVSTNNGATWTVASDISLISIASGSYLTQYVNLAAYAGETVRVAFYAQSTVSGGDNNLHIDNISIDESTGEICYPAATLAASNVTTNSATITWTGDAASYEIYNMADTSLVATVTTTSYDLTGLTPNTEYQYGVVAICSSSESPWSYVSFRTSCAAYGLPFTESFSATLASDPCWRGANILYADGVTPTMGANSNWTYSSSASNGIEAGHYRVNIYGSSCYKWLITPEIDLTTATSPMLTFDAVFTAYSGTGAASGFESNDSQMFLVLVSTNNGATWTVASNIALTSIAGTAYATQYVDLTAYAGQTVRVAFYAQSTVSGGDNNLHLDNIAIDEVVGEVCYPVTGLAASNITADGATLTWTGDAASYNVYAIAADTTLVQNVTTNTITLTGLTAMTQYTYGVRSVCGTDESDMMTVTFTTACAAVTLPYTETFESTSATRDCWTLVSSNESNVGGSTGMGFLTVNNREVLQFSSYSSATDYNQYGYSPLLSPSADATGLQVSVVYGTRSSDYLYFGYISGNDTVWDPTAYNTAGTSSNPNWQTYTAIIPATATQLAVHYYGNYAYYAWIDSVVVNELTAAYCYAVTGLTADSVTPTSIHLTWTDANNSGATYTVYNMADTSVVATGIATTGYEVTGLTALTGYTFGVVTNCTATDASDIVVINAATACSGATCTIEINGADSYGDGWNGNAINVMQAGVVIGTFTLTSGSSATETFSVCSGAPVSFEWVLGSYATETSFEIKDGGGMVVYTCADGSTLTEGAAFYTLTDACPSCIPAAVTVDAATETSVTISWTGTAASYDVYNGTTLVTSTTANTYTFTGLTHSTTYTFGVQAICSATDTAAMTIVTVATACADVTTLPYMEGFESGLGCWTTVNGSADGMPWYALNEASNAHTGTGFAVSFSYYNYTSMHADAWLISPKFVLPTVNAGDTLNFSWWYQVDAGYPLDLYDVMLSTTTNDTAAFTTTLLAVTPDSNNGEYTQMLVDLTAYAGQSIYLAFHHHDSYDQDFLMIDDIFMGVGAAPVPDPDSMQVNVAVNDPTMGTTNPAPGTHYFHVGEAASVVAVPNDGYHLTGWTVNLVAGGITLVDTTYNYAFDDVFDLYGGWIVEEGDDAFVWTVTANFAAGTAPVMHDSVTVITSVNDTTMGTVTPAPGTHYYVLGDTILIGGIQPNPGYYVYALRMTVSHPILGTITDETITDTAILAEMVGMYDTLIVDEESMMGMIVTFNVIFAAEGAAPQTYTVEVAYDITKGTVTGADTYVAGVNVTLTAIAYEGYTFVAWVEGNDTVGRNTVYTIANIDADHYLTAVFAVASTGIEDVDMENVNIYSTNDKIVVRGAEGKQVVLFDVNGRVLSREANATEQVEFRVYNSGVYLVKVNNAAAKRVVVVR